MKYYQTVKLSKVDFKIVNKAFNDINFVKFLTSFQPVKIINWSGIEDDKMAFFKLWFLGWNNFKVKHSNYIKNKNELSFIDEGVELPLGLKSWHHKHIVEKKGNGTIIIDSLTIEHTNSLIGYILLPMFISPIIIRKILYRIYFFKKI